VEDARYGVNAGQDEPFSSARARASNSAICSCIACSNAASVTPLASPRKCSASARKSPAVSCLAPLTVRGAPVRYPITCGREGLALSLSRELAPALSEIKEDSLVLSVDRRLCHALAFFRASDAVFGGVRGSFGRQTAASRIRAGARSRLSAVGAQRVEPTMIHERMFAAIVQRRQFIPSRPTSAFSVGASWALVLAARIAPLPLAHGQTHRWCLARPLGHGPFGGTA
jgi:hypothetical protein